MELKCEICGEVFKSTNEKNPKFNISLNLNKHIKNTHNLSTEQYIINVYYNGKRPLCACGCGEPVKFVRKNCFFTERYGFKKYSDCTHVYRDIAQKRKANPEKYISTYNDEIFIKHHYEKNYGLENIKNALNDFMNNDMSLLEITKKYAIDKRTLKTAWYKLKLITNEEYNKKIKYTQYKLSIKHRRTKFKNAETICEELYKIICNKPNKYTIFSLINEFNETHIEQIEVDRCVILKKMEELYGDDIYTKLNYGIHSKEELSFINILKFYFDNKLIKIGKRIQYGETRKESYIYDCCINDEILLEYDGVGFYHINTKEKDAIKEILAKQKGYKFLRISYDMAHNPDTIKYIKSLLKNNII